MNKTSCKSSRTLSTARGVLNDDLMTENKKLRQHIIYLKNINLAYAGLVSKVTQCMYSDDADLNSRQRKLARINQLQNQTIYRLQEQLKLHKGLEDQYLILNTYIKNKPYKSILDFIKSYEAIVNDVTSKKNFINSLEGTIGGLKRQLQDEGQIAKLKKKVNELEDKNTKTEVKCQRLMHQMQESIKSNNQLRILSYDTEIKLRQLQIKQKRSARLTLRKSSINLNKQNKCQNRPKLK